MKLLPWWLDFSDEKPIKKQRCKNQTNNEIAMLALVASISALLIALKEKDKEK